VKSVIYDCPVVNRRPAGSSDEYYIGLYKQTPTENGVTYWLDGNSATYRNYYSGEPDDDKSCFYIKGDSNGQFFDDSCDADRYYICKIAQGLPLG